jgi:hypothetical protein
MSATAVASAREARPAPPRRRLPQPLPVPQPISERLALRSYREAVLHAVRTLAAAERLYVELSDGLDAHRAALAGYGWALPPTQKRGFRR